MGENSAWEGKMRRFSVLIVLIVLASLCADAARTSRASAEAIYSLYLPHIGKKTAIGPPPGPEWLTIVNGYRALSLLPPVTENTVWSDGDWKHARYMVKTDQITHDEDNNSPWYTPEGDEAAHSGNVMVSSSSSATDRSAIDLWLQGPFHALGILDPALLQSGFGSYREADGGWQMAATLDVSRGQGAIPGSVKFPILWPGNGVSFPFNSYNGGESPDPLTSCSGYSAPTGFPVIIQLGPGNITPNVTAHSFARGGTALVHCIYDETNYSNPDGGSQSLVRSILNARDAVVLIPRQPLSAGQTYTVSITANGQTYIWTFTIASLGY
jgi:hypothetical protein